MPVLDRLTDAGAGRCVFDRERPMPGVRAWIFSIEALRSFRAELAQFIGPAEHARASTFGSATRVEEYLAGRALVRLAAGIPDAAIVTLPGGKPRIANGPEFSLSHAGGWLSLAVSDSAQIGVDIELASDDGDAVREWTAREAVFKAWGGDAALGPADVRLDVSCADHGARKRSIAQVAGQRFELWQTGILLDATAISLAVAIAR